MGSTQNRDYFHPRHYAKVGKFLKSAREKAGLTQRVVGLSLGYSTYQFISNVEAGIALPPLQKLPQLVKLYRLDVDKFMDLALESEGQKLLRELKPKKSRRSRR